MGKEILMSADIEIEKNGLYRHKSPTFFRRCRYWKSINN